MRSRAPRLRNATSTSDRSTSQFVCQHVDGSRELAWRARGVAEAQARDAAPIERESLAALHQHTATLGALPPGFAVDPVGSHPQRETTRWNVERDAIAEPLAQCVHQHVTA